MGLNWAAGLEGLSEGLGVMAARQVRREEQEIEQLRQENLMRLQQKFLVDRDERNFQQQKEIQKEGFAQQEKLANIRAQESEAREDRRDARLFSQQQTTTDRQYERESGQRETYQRRSDEAYRAGLTKDRQQAVNDVGRIKQRIAEYMKQKAGVDMTGEGPLQIGELAKTDQYAASLLNDLGEAVKRRQSLDSEIGDTPRPQDFSRHNRGSTGTTFPALIPETGF